MGIFEEGAPLSWPETLALSKHVQQHGVQQFINLYNKSKDRKNDPFKWGDEFEYIIVRFDDEKKEAKVACKSQEILNVLHKREKFNLSSGIWSAEFGAYQLESSPLKPFEGSFKHFKTVEQDMRRRRQEVQDLLNENECVLTLVNSLRFCCKDFTYPAYQPRPNDPQCIAKSCYIPDEVIYSGHPRYFTITHNIQQRRGERTQSKLKVFKDENTKLPIEDSPIKEPDVIMFDNTFGCNLQVTVQGADMNETRYLYDQLAPLCPIIQAITAASPIFRGYLTEIDNSYHFLGDGSDDRTAEERGLKPLKTNKCRLTKKRWDSIDSYLTPEADIYNDIELYYEQDYYDQLRKEGVDHVMAKHVAHIFMRDSLILLNDKVNQNDEKDTGHFDNLNSTTWQTLRFKPALPNSELCWRVEFRPCDIQITDFENAAVSCFVILLTRAILHFNLNFLIPISKIDENMDAAQKRNACRKEKFWFRKNVMRLKKTQLNGVTNGNNSNGHINGNVNGQANGNGNANGHVNGHDNYHVNGHDNDHINGHANGHVNGHNYVNGNANDHVNGNTNDHVNGDAKGLYNDHNYVNANDNGHVNGHANGYGDINGHNNINGHSNGHGNVNGHDNKTNGHNQNGISNGLTNGNSRLEDWELMTIDEIFNGKSENCPGLVTLIRRYLLTIDLDNDTYDIIDKYLTLIEKRASGEIPTIAMWLRQQVFNHPEYKKDSVVTESINYDILKKIKKIQEAEIHDFNLIL